MDGGAWWTTVHGVAKSRTGLSDLTLTLMIAQQNNTSCSRVCFPLSSVLRIFQQQCILLKDMFPLLNKNLLTNPVILRCVL